LQGADATHAWVSAWCGPELGWIGFDPTNDVLIENESHHSRGGPRFLRRLAGRPAFIVGSRKQNSTWPWTWCRLSEGAARCDFRFDCQTANVVIPGRAKHEPGIHNHDREMDSGPVLRASGMTSPTSRGTFRPSFAISLSLPKERAQGMSGARCTRGLVCQIPHLRRRTRADRFSGGSPTSPAQWLYGLLRALPDGAGLLSPSTPEKACFSRT